VQPLSPRLSHNEASAFAIEPRRTAIPHQVPSLENERRFQRKRLSHFRNRDVCGNRPAKNHCE
jgi:hypothetical protein